MKVTQSCLTLCDPHGLYCPWDSSGQNTGVGSLSLLQGIFRTQRSNPGFPHCRRILYQPSHQASLHLLFQGSLSSTPHFTRFLLFSSAGKPFFTCLCLTARHVGSRFPSQGSGLHPLQGTCGLNHQPTREVLGREVFVAFLPTSHWLRLYCSATSEGAGNLSVSSSTFPRARERVDGMK